VSLYHYSADRNAHETSFRGSYFITLLSVTNSVGQGWRTTGMRHSQLFFCFISFVRLICVYIHIHDCVETVYELPLLPNNTARETFLHNQERCEVWLDIYHWGAGLAVTGRIRDIGHICKLRE
jgi:hypothetical protein